MPLDLQKTLSEARAEVLNRVGMGAQGDQTNPAHPLIDSFIRQAQRDVYFEADWIEIHRYTDVPLIALQSEYDWPDDTEPGQIIRMSVLNDDNREEQLVGGIRPQDRSRQRNLTDGGLPALFGFQDGIIELLPFPSIDWVTLKIEYIASPSDLINDTDRLSFDSELIIRMAVVFTKDHYGMDNSKDEARLIKYINHIRSQQSDGGGFQLGGSQSRYVRRGTDRDRTSRRRRTRSGAYFFNENPFFR